MSRRMAIASSSAILLLGLLGVPSNLNQSAASVKGLSLENRHDNVSETTAARSQPQDPQRGKNASTDPQTLTEKVMKDIEVSSESVIHYTQSKKGKGEQNGNSNILSTNAHQNSHANIKTTMKSLLHNLATDPKDIDDDSQEESSIDRRPDFYHVDIRDEFRCLPCQCYFTMSRSIVASCKSSVADINAVLPNETQQLTISSSLIKIFHASDFLQYHSLQNLSVSNNNNMHAIANSSLHIHLLSLNNLDLSFNDIVDIFDGSFTMFPNLQSLKLEHNHIQDISKLTFQGLMNLQFLNLSGNHLSVLINGSLDHFQKLRVLDLSNNSIHIVFMPGVFANLVYLQKLYMNTNQHSNISYPIEEIARLTYLTSLSIEGISDHFMLGPKIRSLKRLATLHVGFSRKNQCRLEHISESFLENVPYLQTVRFSNCPLKRVDINVYRNVKHIRKLEFISTYPYDIFKALDGLEGLQNSSLKSLSLIKLIPNGCPFICLYEGHAKYLGSTKLEVIDLSYNRVGYMDIQFINGLPKTLRKLVICGNELIEPKLLTDKLSFLNNLELIDLGTYSDTVPSDGLSRTQVSSGLAERQTSSGLLDRYDDTTDWDAAYIVEPVEYLNSTAAEEISHEEFMNEKNFSQKSPICTDHFGNDDITGIRGAANSSDQYSMAHPLRHLETAPVEGPMLTYLRAPGFLEMNMKDLFKDIVKYHYKHLTYLDLSYCALPSLSHSSNMPPWIQAVNFNGNYFRHIHHKVFHYNNSLTYFSLNNNALGYIFAYRTEQIFIRLNNLIYLDLSTNMIYKLPANFFRGLEKLQILKLRDNKLGLLNMNFSRTPKLEYLDLSKNSISWISKSSRDDLDIIGTSHSLYIDLTLNPLQCTCEGLEVLHWIWASNIHFVSKDMLKCIGDDGSPEYVGNIDDRVRTLQRQCARGGLIIVLCVASIAVMCFLVMFGVMYRYRWQLRYIRNIALSRFIGYKPRETARTEYRFDAFIVYSDMSRQFVVGDCLQELEVKRGHRLCVDGRDFMPGTYEVSAIVSAIQNSRKTVLILSPDFYDEQFSEYCVKMALMEEIYKKRSVLYLCVYRPLPDDEMSKSYDILMIMKRNNYLEFPPETETSDEVRQNFWDQLAEIIGHSVTEELPGSTE